MKEYEIWCEGYRATGEEGTAYLIGTAFGNTFNEACENFTYPEDLKDWEGKIYKLKGSPLNLDKNSDGTYTRGGFRGARDMEPGIARTEAVRKGGNYSIWACQLFDNEADARESFG